MTTTTEVFTIRDAVTLSTLIGWAQSCTRVRWIDDEDSERSGHLRSIAPGESGDVRDGHIRVTMSSGVESTLTVRDAMDLLGSYRMGEER